jgi:hypothetical protein
VPFPKFGIKLREDQSADAFMIEVEKRVNVMVGEYTMNEYKAYKALVKHKKRINRVFSEVCGDKSFSSRGPGPKLKVPAVAVASCSAAPINAPRIRSSKRGSSSVSEGTSSGSSLPGQDLWSRRSVSARLLTELRMPSFRRFRA